MITAAFRRRNLVSFFLFVLVSLFAAYWLIHRSPSVAAGAADVLRAVIGNEGVASLESLVFQAQDTARQAEYDLGLGEASAPWAVEPVATMVVPTVTATPTVAPMGETAGPVVAINWQATVIPATPAAPADAGLDPVSSPEQSLPTPLPTATPWRPVNLQPLGTLAGEGIWSPYLYGPAGEVVAYRTFVQPDPERPFAVVGIVAFDLNRTRLNFVLGTQEPGMEGGPRGTGLIPAETMAGGNLLATFNGGFKATHGNYGAMSGGVTALPAIDGLGTVAFYQDGSVRIGEWGMDIVPSERLVAWRQNAPLVVQSGEMTEAAERNSIVDWSGSIDGAVVTWRSGLGLSFDRQTLYYFAGSSLNMPSLGRAMLAARVYQGMLLDINPYWVHFTAIRPMGDGSVRPLADPLFPEDMKNHADRFLQASARDFFYVTVE